MFGTPRDPREEWPMREPVRAVLAVVAAGSVAAAVVLLPPGPAGEWGRYVGIGLALVQGLALWWIERRPVLMLAVVIGASAVVQAWYPPVGAGAALAALFSYAHLRPPRISRYALAATALLAVGTYIELSWEDAIVTLGAVLFSWMFGELNRSRVQNRRDSARLVVANERARIARELHDVVAHHVSVVVVQAAAADDVFDARPDRAREAIRAIEATGRQALGELRRVVGALPDDENPDEPPGLDRIDDLAASVRAAGLEVAVNRDEPTGEIPPDVGLAAHRIVQEALTNVVRHADGADRVGISVRCEPEAVRVTVTDNGRGSVNPGNGTGVDGMRERAERLGGRLEAGPHRGGFTVHAVLPVSR